MKAFRRALGDPGKFVQNISSLASAFRTLSGAEYTGLDEIRAFVAGRNYELSKDAEAFQATLAAFADLLVKRHAQELIVKGFLTKRIVVRSHNFSCDLLDLFYRCVFEGLDLDETSKP